MTKSTKKSSPKALEKLIHHTHSNDQQIVFKGAKTHNLKNIDITLPKNKVITVTGVSGSGKSSFAFDTLYKEGQYRYIESLSSYLRQFFNLGTRPEVDYSSGLSPAIAIEQNKRVGNVRSTVGTLTEIDDYLRLLFAKLGTLYCYSCGTAIKAQTIDQIMDQIRQHYNNEKIYLLQEAGIYADHSAFQKFFEKNRKKVEAGKGFTRYLVMKAGENGGKDKKKSKKTEEENSIEYFYLETPQVPKEYFPIKAYGIFDRVTVEESKFARLKEDIIKILSEVKKFGVAQIQGENAGTGEVTWFTDKMFCANCNIEYPEFTTQHFSSNRQEGACPNCHGIGQILEVDFDKVIDPMSTYDKAILPRRDSNLGQTILKKLAQKYSMDEQSLWKDLPEWFKEAVLHGDNELLRLNMPNGFMSITYKGVKDILTGQYNKGMLTVDFQAMLDMVTCPECEGAKLRRESLNVFIETPRERGKGKVESERSDPAVLRGAVPNTFGKENDRTNIHHLQQRPINEMIEVLERYQSSTNQPLELVDRILGPLLDRSKTITHLGLHYLMLSRQIDTLSGGEIQRLRLAKQLGNKLTGIIYVLDEPTIGLDDHEIQKTIQSIRTLQEIGNTIVVVEHNEAFIKASDRVVEIGPGAGDFGGHVVFNGPYEEFLKQKSLTAEYVTGKKTIQAQFDHQPTGGILRIRKAKKHNLKSIDVDIRLGSFSIITGPSGAGKTTLMFHTLFSFLNDKQKFIQSYIRLNMLKQGMSRTEIISAPIMKKEEYEHLENLALQEFYKHIGVESIRGHESIKNTIYVDQTSIGKTPRSCPATFIGTFDNIRKIYAGVTEAKYIGFNAGHFSFNSSKGACPECEGYGYKKVELQFLPDTYVPCPLCQGKRYKPEILEIKRHGKTIGQVLDMYIQDAYEFFKEMDFIADELKLLCDIGLGYLRMGQPAQMLSGGESQRLKLVKHLLKQYKGHTVYFLDEPTVGLHPSDVEKLLSVLKRFLDKGDTILMIEHDKALLGFADEVIRLKDGLVIKG